MKLNNKGSLSLIAIGAILAAALLVGTLLYFARTNNANKAPTQTSNTILDDSAEQSVDELMSRGAQQDVAKQSVDEAMDYSSLDYMLSGQLRDVTNGETIRQTVFDGSTSGQAQSLFGENGFLLYATFDNLSQPATDDFYEGWIVNSSKGSVISTGELTLKDGEYTNVYVSDADLSDHTFYVLTLEPNDNDPAPADHVVEGRLN